MTGLYEANTNPILTDQNIQSRKIANFSDPEIIKLVFPMLKGPNLDIKNNECNDGVFNIKGYLYNKEVYEKGENVDLNYFYPPDLGAICRFNETKKNEEMNIECNNKDYFESEAFIIDTQILGGKLIIEKNNPSEGYVTCDIGPYSLKEFVQDESIKNNYFNIKSSSSGLSGAAISCIVIVCFVVLVLIGILIALIRKRIVPKTNLTNYNTSIIPVSTSSVSII